MLQLLAERFQTFENLFIPFINDATIPTKPAVHLYTDDCVLYRVTKMELKCIAF